MKLARITSWFTPGAKVAQEVIEEPLPPDPKPDLGEALALISYVGAAWHLDRMAFVLAMETLRAAADPETIKELLLQKTQLLVLQRRFDTRSDDLGFILDQLRDVGISTSAILLQLGSSMLPLLHFHYEAIMDRLEEEDKPAFFKEIVALSHGLAFQEFVLQIGSAGFYPWFCQYLKHVEQYKVPLPWNIDSKILQNYRGLTP